MDGILKFNLEDPHERNAFKRACSATDVYIALHSISRSLRNYRKYTELTEDQMSLLVEIEEDFYKNLSENDVDLDDLE